MPQTDRDRAIALAGVLQAADLVRGIARRGQANPMDVETCLNSLIKIDAASSQGRARRRAGVAVSRVTGPGRSKASSAAPMLSSEYSG